MADPAVVESLHPRGVAARRLSVSLSTVNRLIKSGELPSVVIGRARRVAESDLVNFIERRRDSS